MVQKANTIEELLNDCPVNQTICDNLIRAWVIINNTKYKKIICSISGGSDSDVMLDIVWRCDKDNKVDYVWFDTGLEYQATKDHLKFLEGKYDIAFHSYKAINLFLHLARNMDNHSYQNKSVNLSKDYKSITFNGKMKILTHYIRNI